MNYGYPILGKQQHNLFFFLFQTFSISNEFLVISGEKKEKIHATFFCGVKDIYIFYIYFVDEFLRISKVFNLFLCNPLNFKYTKKKKTKNVCKIKHSNFLNGKYVICLLLFYL